jgi:hypothetical protein
LRAGTQTGVSFRVIAIYQSIAAKTFSFVR